MVPPAESVVTGLAAASDALYVRRMNGGISELLRLGYADDGATRSLPLPYKGDIDALAADVRVPGLLFSLGGWTHFGSVYAYEPRTHKVVDIGEEWARVRGGLPLPLGGNAIRRGLGSETIARVSRVCRASIRWAADHADEVTRALLDAETRSDVGLDRASLDTYLDMYANEDTLDAPDDVRRAIDELFERGRAAGLLPSDARAEFAP